MATVIPPSDPVEREWAEMAALTLGSIGQPQLDVDQEFVIKPRRQWVAWIAASGLVAIIIGLGFAILLVVQNSAEGVWSPLLLVLVGLSLILVAFTERLVVGATTIGKRCWLPLPWLNRRWPKDRIHLISVNTVNYGNARIGGQWNGVNFTGDSDELAIFKCSLSAWPKEGIVLIARSLGVPIELFRNSPKDSPRKGQPYGTYLLPNGEMVPSLPHRSKSR